ncbi:hypothetical protein D3C86_2046260 [compost metagenome]
MAFDLQPRHLAQRVADADCRIGSPDVVYLELVVELFFRHDDANLAHVGTAGGTDQFHRGELPWRGTRQVPAG